MTAVMACPLGQYTHDRPAESTPRDGRVERLARQFGPAACRRAVAAFDRRGLPGVADVWFRAALLADGLAGRPHVLTHRPDADPTDERGSAC